MKIQIRIIISVVAVFLSVGCAKGGDDAPGAQSSFTLQQEETAEPSWVATWDFSEPVNGLNFSRQYSIFRSRAWEIVTPGVRFLADNGREFLVSEEPVKQFQIRIRKNTIKVENDYAFLLPLGKNGAILFAGHFAATPFTCSSDCQSTREPVAVSSSTSKYVSRPDLFFYVNGNFGQGQFSAASEPKGFVYFGKVQAVETESFTALVDPNLPNWAIQDIHRQFPTVLLHFASQTGFQLKKKPTILFSYSVSTSGPNDSYGAVLESNVILAVEGGKWLQQIGTLREELLHLIAHETFHLWNGNLFSSPEREGGAWLHEGSAEAMAWRSLMDLGYISKERFVEAQNKTINRCSSGRDQFNPQSKTASWQILRSQYDCGAAMHFLMQASAQARGSRWALYSFWQRLFQRAASNGQKYTHEMFFDSVAELAGRELVAKLRLLADSGIPSTDSFFVESFKSLGIPADGAAWSRTFHLQAL